MKSLAERHADRAQRKADNMTESDLNGSTGGMGNAMDAINAANEAVAALSPDQRAELAEIMQGQIESDRPAEDGFEMAGIGVVNPFTASLATQMELADTDAQRGILPEPSFDPANGNINGAAIEQAGNGAGAGGNGWGTPGADDDDDADELPELRANMTVAEVEAIAADEEVDLTGATNNDQRIAKIEEARKAKAETAANA